MKAFVILLAVSVVVGLSAARPVKPGDAVMKGVRAGFAEFSASADTLDAVIRRLNPFDRGSVKAARRALIDCRLKYKGIEFFLEYFFRSSALIYNQPAKYEAEEPFIEWEAPRGLQYIELLLFEPLTDSTIRVLGQQSGAVAGSARDLDALLYDFQLSDGALMESLRLQLIRVMTLEITGYDAPLLESGIAEAAASMRAFAAALRPYLGAGGEADSVRCYVDRTLGMLERSPAFDGFDRMAFLTGGVLPLQRHFGVWVSRAGLWYQSVAALNYGAADLFSRDAINVGAFPHVVVDGGDSLAALGRRLFFDSRLSFDGSRSCATCHRPDRYFSDGKVVSAAVTGHSALLRNTPSLLYAGYQYSQFWDGRVRSLEDQIEVVLTNPVEMGVDTARVDVRSCAAALAAYVRTMAPFTSALDNYFAGERRALSSGQIRGFNLFMGKGRCATCHFAPLFNGLRPPFYDVTEYEVLGVPAGGDFRHAIADSDSGRLGVYPIAFYRGAFKTPTVRDAAQTGPYMHNGRLADMGQVIDFYNKGGGVGIGLPVGDQTLDSRPLRLTAAEVGDLVAFMDALTDR